MSTNSIRIRAENFLQRTWFKLSFFRNRFFVRIWPFEVSDQKIKFDGMFKMPGRDFEKFSFSAGKMADSQNPGFKSEKTLRCTVSHQLYYLWSTFGDVSSDFDEIFMIFKSMYRTDQRKRASTIVTAVLEQMKVKDYFFVEI